MKSAIDLGVDRFHDLAKEKKIARFFITPGTNNFWGFTVFPTVLNVQTVTVIE